MTEKMSKSRAIVYFLGFLIFVGVFSGIIAIIHQLLRKNGVDSPHITAILAAVTIFVYYKSWRWMCRKLDLFASK